MCHYPVSLQVIWPKRKIDIRGLESKVKNEWNLSLDSSWDCLLVVQKGRVLGIGRAFNVRGSYLDTYIKMHTEDAAFWL